VGESWVCKWLAKYTDMTARELETLKWVALGKSDNMIANLIGVTEQDVIRHVEDITKELNANNRVDAGLKAIKLGLV